MYLDNRIMEALMNNYFGRRTFLKAGAATTLVAGTQVFPGFPALADFAAGPALRRNASTMAANDPILRGYRTAIARMRAMPDTNPCSWFYQAAIHGTFDPRNLPSWNTCHLDPHFFWAWHRMYLYFFERIIRKQSGMYDWAIPYWDWTNGAQRAMPAPFRDSANILFDGTRNASVNGGAQLSTGLATSVANAFLLTDYFNAQSSIDFGPHGSVHVSIGGNMGAVRTAATDPIFWVHHAQIDRLWNLWLAQGGGRGNPLGDAPWKALRYTFFDECCQPVTMSGCQVIRAANQLSYTYEGEPPQFSQYCLRIPFDIIRDLAVLIEIKRPFQLRRGPVRIPIPPPPPEARERIIRAVRSGQHLALRIAGIEAATNPGISWEVHVGPPGFLPNERSFVSLFGLFSGGLRDGHHFHPGEFVIPLDPARGQDPTKMQVVFVPVSGVEGNEDPRRIVPKVPVTIGELAIITDSPAKAPPQDEQEKARREEDMR